MCGKSLGLLEERIGSCTGFSSYFKQNVEKHISAAVSRSPAARSFVHSFASFIRFVEFGSVPCVLLLLLFLLASFVWLVLYVFVCFLLGFYVVCGSCRCRCCCCRCCSRNTRATALATDRAVIVSRTHLRVY